MANLTLFQDGLLSRLLQLLGLPGQPEAGMYVNYGGTSMPGAYILFLKGLGSIQDHDDAAKINRGISCLQKALQQDDGYVQARLAMAEALLAKFKLSRDRAWLQKAMDQGLLAKQAAGAWPPVLLAWGRLLQESGQKADATDAYRQALRLDERNYAACIELAISHMSAGRIGEAENLYRRAIALRPGYFSAYDHIAFFYQAYGRVEEALASYQKVTGLAPGYTNGFINLGSMYLNKGDLENAKLIFKKAIAIQPDPDAQSNLATAYFFEGEYRQAFPLLSKLARETNEFRKWGNLADTCRQLPDQKQNAGAAYQKAIALAESLLAAKPDDSEILSCLAMYYSHQGEKDKAQAAIARALSLAPANLEIIRRAILVHENTQERSRALGALREYLERMGNLFWIEREPDLVGLRRDPAFIEIAAGNK
jgi:tetratricopeptide (TPR) repeat protein